MMKNNPDRRRTLWVLSFGFSCYPSEKAPRQLSAFKNQVRCAGKEIIHFSTFAHIA